MANISNVSGKITVTADSLDIAKKVIKAIEVLTNHWYYSIEFYNEPEEAENSISYGFSADGRWSFKYNIELFGSWLQNTEQETKEQEEAFATLFSLGFSIHFEYDEDETGCEFIGKGKGKLTHKPDTPLSAMTLDFNDFTSYELTVQNLINIRGFDDEFAEHYLDYLEGDE